MTQVLLQIRDPLLTDIADLSPPAADKILFYDFSGGEITWLDVGTGLTITGTTISSAGITGTGTLGTLPKVTNATGPVYGDSIASESSGVITIAGEQVINLENGNFGSTDSLLTITHRCTGTVGNFFGSDIDFHLEASDGFVYQAATHTVRWLDGTAASRKAEYFLTLGDYVTPDRVIIHCQATGSAATIGFLGATPAIRQTGDAGTALVMFGLMSGTPTFAVANLSGTTTVGQALVTLTNPSAITFIRINADNSVTALSASSFLTAIGGQPLDATLTSLAAYNTNGIICQTAADTFAGRTITGAAARIKISNGDGVAGNPTVDIDTAYVGQTSITTLGTITTGTWTGNKITVPSGGTGLGTFTAHGVIMGNGSSDLAVSSAGTAGQVFTSGGSGADGSYQDALGIPSSTTVLGSNVGLGTSYGNVGLSVSLPGVGTWDVVVEGGVGLNITVTTIVTDYAYIQGKLRDTTNNADITSTVDRMLLLIGQSGIVYVSFTISGRITLSGAATVNLQMKYTTSGSPTVNSALCLTDTNIYYKKVAP